MSPRAHKTDLRQILLKLELESDVPSSSGLSYYNLPFLVKARDDIYIQAPSK